MLAPDVSFEGWTATDWTRFLSLFSNPTPAARAEGEARGGVIAVHDNGRLRKLLHTRAGRLELANEPWPVALRELAERHRAAWALALRVGALEELMESFGARAQRGDDVALQLLGGAQVLRDLQSNGGIELWPRRLLVPPMSAHTVVARTLRRVCPDDHAVVVGLFDRGDLWTGVVLRRRATGIDLILGPDALRSAMGLLSGDWRRDYRHMVAAVAHRVGPLAAGFFTEATTLRALLADNSAGAWARAAAVRDIVLSPLSGAVALPIAIDAMRGLFVATQGVVSRFDPTGAFTAVRRDDGTEAKGLASGLRKLLMRGTHE